MKATPKFIPEHNDFVFRALRFVSGDNPFVAIIEYVALTCGVTVTLAYMSHSVIPLQNEYVELSEDWVAILDFGIIVPIAVYLIFNFYNTVKMGFTWLVESGSVAFEEPETANEFISAFNRKINQPWHVIVALILAVGLNTVFFISKHDAWNELSAGFPAWWFRLFATVNYFVLFVIVFKSAVVVQGIKSILSHSLRIQPLHPDGCGGIAHLGKISLSINYFVSLIGLHVLIIGVMGTQPFENPVFLGSILGYTIFSTYVFFVPLSYAHDAMKKEKLNVLGVLNDEFQTTYLRVAEGLPTLGIQLEDAQKIESLERLHRIASSMPVWPLNTRVLGNFTISVFMPVAGALAVELLKTTIDFGK